jgi:succinyl-CoA synthetase alpha subunit
VFHREIAYRAAAKIAIFQECDVEVAETPSDMADALRRSARVKHKMLA